MTIYLVQWAIHIEADSPQEAAEKARACQLRADTEATFFDVYEDGVRRASIDLTYPEESILVTMEDILNPDPNAPEPRENIDDAGAVHFPRLAGKADA
jgi:hypothetical protein